MATPMDWTPVWNGIRDWVVAVTGLQASDVNWRDWPQKFAGPTQVRLNPLAAPMVDTELSYSDTGTDLEAAQEGLTLLTVSIAVRSRSQDPAKFGLREAKLLEAAIVDTEELVALEALCVYPARVARGVQIGAYEWDGRMEQLCTLDIEFAVSTTQAMGPVGWFDHVEVSSDTSNVDGSPLPAELQLSKKQVGPPP